MSEKYFVRSVVSKTPKIRYDYYQIDNGRKVSDSKLLEKLDAIKIPPTYGHVILSPSSSRRLQATANDGTGRKQYFYSQEHLETTRKEKYQNLLFLGMNLDKLIADLRKHTREGIATGKTVSLDGLNALALQTMLLCNFRVGTTQNRDKYQTYGLTTLTPDHIKFSRAKIGNTTEKIATIEFVGKKKQINESKITHPEMVKMLEKLVHHNSSVKHDPQLFAWDNLKITPSTMNEYLQRYHPDITTKTWRTWFANTAYIGMMNKYPLDSKNERKSASNQVVRLVAEDLHHTPSVCKKNYLMTELIDLYVNNEDKWNQYARTKNADEFFMKFLKDHYHLDKKWIDRRSRETSRKYDRENTHSRTESRTNQTHESQPFGEGLNFNHIAKLPIKVFETKSLSTKSDLSFR